MWGCTLTGDADHILGHASQVLATWPWQSWHLWHAPWPCTPARSEQNDTCPQLVWSARRGVWQRHLNNC